MKPQKVPDILHRLPSPIGMDLNQRVLVVAQHMRPVEFFVHPYPGFIGIIHTAAHKAVPNLGDDTTKFSSTPRKHGCYGGC